MTLTLDKMLDAIAKLPPAPQPMKLLFTSTALEATNERLFPSSKNRSARIRKKLMKRHGGEFRMKPCIWRVGSTYFAHPIYREQFASISPSPYPPIGILKAPVAVLDISHG